MDQPATKRQKGSEESRQGSAVDSKGSESKEPDAAEQADLCPSLRRCIDKWGLSSPYYKPSDDDQWAAYYAERSALEFRRVNFWYGCPDPRDEVDDDEDHPNYGEEPPKIKTCDCVKYRRRGDQDPPPPVIAKSADCPFEKCSKCLKVRDDKLSAFVDTPKEVDEKWASLVANDKVLHQVYAATEFETKVPYMRPHCSESYAEDCHYSGRTKCQYDECIDGMKERIVKTLTSTNAMDETAANQVADGLYILCYWANFEECDADANPRTVEFETRLYSTIGNGSSVELAWYYHFRPRNYIPTEKYSAAYAVERELEGVQPKRPSDISFNFRKCDEDEAVAILDGDSDEDHVHKTFATLSFLKDHGKTLLGEEFVSKVSARKIFGVLARASGAHAIRQEGGWIFAGMRNRYELYPEEESDGEETGSEDGPTCIIS